MAEEAQAQPGKNALVEWTLMFYFASDNPLAPAIVSQLKALQSAGFNREVNVVAHFDPNTKGTPTHIFDVNLYNKIVNAEKDHMFFHGDDPYIRNLVFDKLWGEEDQDGFGVPIRKRIAACLKQVRHDNFARAQSRGAGANKAVNVPPADYNPPTPGPEAVRGVFEESSPTESLGKFLTFCAKSYRARHYMLFIIGHGLVVGNDIFLYDEDATAHSLKLKDLVNNLSQFKEALAKIKSDEPASFKPEETPQLDLIGFHSCSLSALEVACELKAITNYMLASEGSAFVGSWPYREILMRIFKDVNRNKTDPAKIKETIEHIFDYILANSYDFQLAGYSFELCLCDPRQVDSVAEPLSELARLLIDGLKLDAKGAANPRIKERILLAHWEAQSYWQESYTDLYDFCCCLKKRCEAVQSADQAAQRLMTLLAAQCGLVMGVLDKQKLFTDEPESVEAEQSKKLIIRTDFAGPECQYSHGLSIYFPWSMPTDGAFWEEQYPNYVLNQPGFEASTGEPVGPTLEGEKTWTSWREFLQTYFDTTRRYPINPALAKVDGSTTLNPTEMLKDLLEEITRQVWDDRGALSGSVLGSGGGSGASLDSKPGATAGEGGDCNCPSIKNYPSITRERVPGRLSPKPEEPNSYPLSAGMFRLFQSPFHEDNLG